MWGTRAVCSFSLSSVLPACLLLLVSRFSGKDETPQAKADHAVKRSCYRHLIRFGSLTSRRAASSATRIEVSPVDMGTKSICTACVGEVPGLASASGRAVPHGCVKLGANPDFWAQLGFTGSWFGV